ncbi:MAG: helix-turn-helix domain-containing protein [Verrucomicrobiales bacterium]|nr:helix-turn-helix domain-containing protein [Verrucomicrobiales bacterium]
MNKHYLLSKAEIAKALSLSTRAIDSLVASGKIPSVRVGTRRLFDPEEITEALKSGVASPENGGLNAPKNNKPTETR